MAKRHTTDGYTNPEVRFERSDINLRDVAWCGVALAGLVVVSMIFLVGYFNFLQRQEKPRKESKLPPASVDADRWPPAPMLEGIEDVRDKKFKLAPPRAEEYLATQEKILQEGDPAKGVLPIAQAIDQVAGKLPYRKQKNASGHSPKGGP
jgi:hypothetical protein